MNFSKLYPNIDFYDLKAVGVEKTSDALTVRDRIALGDAKIRQHISYAIMGLFGVVSLAALCLLYVLFEADRADLAARVIGPGDQIVDPGC